MNKILRIVLYAGLIFLQAGCGWGQNTQIKVKAFVHDSDGNPVEGVTVRLILPRYREGDRNQRETAITNRSGIAVVSGIAQQDYYVGAGKPGYYYTKGAQRGLLQEIMENRLFTQQAREAHYVIMGKHQFSLMNE